MANKTIQQNNPKGWKLVKLKEISRKIGSGITPRGGSEVYTKKGIIFLRSQNIQNGHLSLADVEYISEEMDARMSNSKVEKNDILYNITGASIGRSTLYTLNDKANVNQHVCIIRLKNENPSFVNYFLRSSLGKKQLDSFQAGGNRQGLNYNQLGSFKFLLPQKTVQDRIVAVLEVWDQAIDKLKRKIEVKKEIKKGLMQKLLTGEIRLAGFTGNWSIHNLGELGKIISGGTPETADPSYWGNDYIWITPTEITKLKSRYILYSDKRISTLGLKNSSATLIPPQSLILCSRATIAECAINTVEVTTNQGFKNYVPDKIDIYFLYYWVKLNKKAFLRISAGSTFLEFGKGDIEKLRIAIPDMSEQKAISEILTKADDEVERLQQKLAILKDQKRYLLNNLITGIIPMPETLSIP